jgi:hypothetical protein
MTIEDFSFRPKKSELGEKSTEAPGAKFVWLSPVEEPEHRFRYAVIKDEKALLQIQPNEGRFKKGLSAWRFESDEAEEHSVWLVSKVKPNRVDLTKIP